MTTYDSLLKLWDDYQTAFDDHVCTNEEFESCEVCSRSVEARILLGGKTDQVMDLLKREHNALAELAESVIQEVAVERPERVQKAMLRALAVLKC